MTNTPENISKIKRRLFELENKCFERGFLTSGERILFNLWTRTILSWERDKQDPQHHQPNMESRAK